MPLLVERGLPAAAFVVGGMLDGDTPFWFEEARALVASGGRLARPEDGVPDAICRALKRMADDRRISAIETLRATASSAAPRTVQLTRSELRSLESNGVAIGNHTMTHPCLSRCEDSKVESEITEAHDLLTATLGHAPVAFAYPDGDRDDRAATRLREIGYSGAFLFDHRWVRPPVSDPFQISRVRVNSSTTIERFRLILSGLHPAIHRVRGGV
jgi:peptidoglycan/xylan/chitin deacetylase (PgdA/CDA1 family)